MTHPYRDPGREITAPKFPRVVFERDDRRLIQLDVDSFVIEKIRTHVDSIGCVTKTWMPDLSFSSKDDGTGSLSSIDFRSRKEGGHALWLARRLAELL